MGRVKALVLQDGSTISMRHLSVTAREKLRGDGELEDVLMTYRNVAEERAKAAWKDVQDEIALDTHQATITKDKSVLLAKNGTYFSFGDEQVGALFKTGAEIDLKKDVHLREEDGGNWKRAPNVKRPTRMEGKINQEEAAVAINTASQTSDSVSILSSREQSSADVLLPAIQNSTPVASGTRTTIFGRGLRSKTRRYAEESPDGGVRGPTKPVTTRARAQRNTVQSGESVAFDIKHEQDTSKLAKTRGAKKAEQAGSIAPSYQTKRSYRRRTTQDLDAPEDHNNNEDDDIPDITDGIETADWPIIDPAAGATKNSFTAIHGGVNGSVDAERIAQSKVRSTGNEKLGTATTNNPFAKPSRMTGLRSRRSAKPESIAEHLPQTGQVLTSQGRTNNKSYEGAAEDGTDSFFNDEANVSFHHEDESDHDDSAQVQIQIEAIHMGDVDTNHGILAKSRDTHGKLRAPGLPASITTSEPQLETDKSLPPPRTKLDDSTGDVVLAETRGSMALKAHGSQETKQKPDGRSVQQTMIDSGKPSTRRSNRTINQTGKVEYNVKKLSGTAVHTPNRFTQKPLKAVTSKTRSYPKDTTGILHTNLAENDAAISAVKTHVDTERLTTAITASKSASTAPVGPLNSGQEVSAFMRLKYPVEYFKTPTAPYKSPYLKDKDNSAAPQDSTISSPIPVWALTAPTTPYKSPYLKDSSVTPKPSTIRSSIPVSAPKYHPSINSPGLHQFSGLPSEVQASTISSPKPVSTPKNQPLINSPVFNQFSGLPSGVGAYNSARQSVKRAAEEDKNPMHGGPAKKKFKTGSIDLAIGDETQEVGHENEEDCISEESNSPPRETSFPYRVPATALRQVHDRTAPQLEQRQAQPFLQQELEQSFLQPVHRPAHRPGLEPAQNSEQQLGRQPRNLGKSRGGARAGAGRPKSTMVGKRGIGWK